MKQLKLLSIFMLVALMAAFASCSKDDDKAEFDDNIDVKLALGTWMCIESTDTYMEQSVKGQLVGTEITINADGTYTSSAKSGVSVMGESGTYTINGNTITAKTTGYTFVMQASFNGNKMNWKGTASNGVSFYYVFQKE